MKFYKENNVNPLASCLPLVPAAGVHRALLHAARETCDRHLSGAELQQVRQHTTARSSDVAHTAPCGSTRPARIPVLPDLTNKATGAA